MTLVEHDVPEAVEAAAVERVPKDLGGHDQNRRARVHFHVAGQDADRISAERAREVGELLIRERLQRSRVG